MAFHTVTLPSQLCECPLQGSESPGEQPRVSSSQGQRAGTSPDPDIVLQHLLPSLCSHTGRQMGDIASDLGAVRPCGCLLQGQRPTEAPDGEKRLCMHISEHGCAVACWVHMCEHYGLHIMVSVSHQRPPHGLLWSRPGFMHSGAMFTRPSPEHPLAYRNPRTTRSSVHLPALRTAGWLFPTPLYQFQGH